MVSATRRVYEAVECAAREIWHPKSATLRIVDVQHRHLFVCATALIALLSATSVTAASSQRGAPIEFTLTDQDGQTRVVDYPRGKVSVFVVADQKGSADIAGWIEPIYARYEKRIEISGIAALPGIPPMFQGLFRREFKKRLTYPVMLDWDGEVSRGLGYRKEGAQLLVVSRSGEIVLSKTGPAARESLGSVYTAIDALLARR